MRFDRRTGLWVMGDRISPVVPGAVRAYGRRVVFVNKQASGGSSGEPIYNPGVDLLHAEETWANLATFAAVASTNRSDGGGPWSCNPAQDFGDGLTGALIGTPDGMGAQKYITFDNSISPPIRPHGTGNHADEWHWCYGGGAGDGYQGDFADIQQDDNAYEVLANSPGSMTWGASTLTDTTKNWSVNAFVGYTVDFKFNDGGTYFETDRINGPHVIVSNTATQITIQGTWQNTPNQSTWYGLSTLTSASKNNRGTNLLNTTLLNKPARNAVVYEWSSRCRGTNYYQGKQVDINGGQSTGIGRSLYMPFDAVQGWGGIFTNELAAPYYDNNGDVRAAYVGICPPVISTPSPLIDRDFHAFPAPVSPYQTIYYKQNLNYGSAAGKYALGSAQRWPLDSIANADGLGLGHRLWEAGWLYHKFRLTSTGVFSRGRIEMWIGKTPGSLIKVIDYIGDNPAHPAYNLVYVNEDGSPMLGDNNIDFFSLMGRTYTGGNIQDIGFVRVWSHTPA